MKNNNNRKKLRYMNILGEYVTEGEEEMEEKIEFGEKVTYLVTSPDRAEPYEIEHIYGQGLPAELIREEVELTAAMNKFVAKAKLIGENTIKERFGFELSDINIKKENGRKDIELEILIDFMEEPIKRLVIPDFITSLTILNSYGDIIKQLEIGENLRKVYYDNGLIIENIKLSKKNKYYKMKSNQIYRFNEENVIEIPVGYVHLGID